ncbi:MAG: PD40 domain-containing protein [Bacteroidales bacterium]|nr:PD40 domain-containing protein [Bacteroidales bacterium]
MKLKIYIMLLFLALLTAVQGQEYSTQNKKAIKLYERAMETLYQGKNDAAMNGLEQALQEDDGFLEAHLVLADLMSNIDLASMEEKGEPSRHYRDEAKRHYRDEAKRHYRAVVESKRDFFAPAWVNLGKLELYDRNYDEAIKCFETYLELDKRESETELDAKRGLKMARFRKEALAHPVPFNPQNLGAAVNSRDDEYLPSLTADGQTLVFTRRFPRKATTTANTKEEEDLYVSTLNNGQWSRAERMPEPVNSTDNEGAQCISQDGRIMFYTACNRNDGGGRCDLYMCVNKSGRWSKPRNLGSAVNSGAWEGQPTFSIDGRTLYFVSNRKGGHGGMDIWKTTFDGGQWTAPENLGPEINTEFDEMSPFIHFDDHTLYFSSNRPEGMGGMDLFVAKRDDNGRWTQPTNLGYPINTEGDDNNLIVSADGRTAIFASQRDGGQGKMDLYSFELPVESRPTVAICFKGRVSNAKDGQPVASDIRIIDLANGTTVANTSSDGKNGLYIVSLPAGKDYAFHVTANGFLFHSQNVEKNNENGNEQWQPVTVDIALHPIESGERIALRNVFFETGRWEILPESEYELAKVVDLLTKNPTLKIELGGHTDNVGRPEANQRLSEQRAKAVYDYLINKGIPSNRLSYKGYGETQPVATNDTNEGRRENRRTEIKVL